MLGVYESGAQIEGDVRMELMYKLNDTPLAGQVCRAKPLRGSGPKLASPNPSRLCCVPDASHEHHARNLSAPIRPIHPQTVCSLTLLLFQDTHTRLIEITRYSALAFGVCRFLTLYRQIGLLVCVKLRFSVLAKRQRGVGVLALL